MNDYTYIDAVNKLRKYVRLFGAHAPKTGLSASIFWLRQKDFRCNPLRPTGWR
jgi:hypothetical protein